jgi:KDO2-lipid IV(A) lauroyltransferase
LLTVLRELVYPAVLAHDGLFWRRLAYLGASRGPRWWVRYSPPFFGLAAAALLPGARRAVGANLRRVRGEANAMRHALDVAHTFTTYAGCLAESLSNGSKNVESPDVIALGEAHLVKALSGGRGAVFVTAHTAGWDIVGPLVMLHHAREVLLVMEAERDGAARRLHDEARRASGLSVVHVGDDPLASLSLLAHLRRGGIVALQLDRVPPGMRAREVVMFGGPAHVPEGPLRLAQAAGVPIVPLFCARLGFRRYLIELTEPVYVRTRSSAELDAAAQRIADVMAHFVRAHPTQWLHFTRV